MQIRECQGYPRDVWKSAAEAVVKHTAVGSAYAMVVSPPQEPEYVFEDEDGEEAPETDDEETEKPVEEDVAEGEEEPGDGEDVPKASPGTYHHAVGCILCALTEATGITGRSSTSGRSRVCCER